MDSGDISFLGSNLVRGTLEHTTAALSSRMLQCPLSHQSQDLAILLILIWISGLERSKIGELAGASIRITTQIS